MRGGNVTEFRERLFSIFPKTVSILRKEEQLYNSLHQNLMTYAHNEIICKKIIGGFLFNNKYSDCGIHTFLWIPKNHFILII